MSICLGSESRSALIAKLGQLERDGARLRRELQAIDDDGAFDPAVTSEASRLSAQLIRQHFEALLDNPDVTAGAGVRDMVCGMIDKIVVSPDGEADVQVTITGTAASLMQAAAMLDTFGQTKKPPAPVASGADQSVVAGAGFEPAAFRL